MLKPLSATLLALAATGAQAQDWSSSASLYGWLPGLSGSVETRFGQIDVEPEGDAESLLGLEAGFLGSFTTGRGPWSVTADILFARLGADATPPIGLLYSEAGVTQSLMALSAYGFYRVADRPGAVVDLGAGLRSFDLSLGIELDGGALPAVDETIEGSWTVPLIAARTTLDIGDSWFLHGVADWGSTSDGDETWQAYGGVGYRFNENWSAELGYRHMEIRKEIRGRTVDVALDGALIGATYSF